VFFEKPALTRAIRDYRKKYQSKVMDTKLGELDLEYYDSFLHVTKNEVFTFAIFTEKSNFTYPLKEIENGIRQMLKQEKELTEIREWIKNQFIFLIYFKKINSFRSEYQIILI